MKSIDYTEIGHKIRQSRISHSYSQEQLAELTGISTAFLGHIERGTRAMSLETLVSICSVLNISIDYLLLDEISETDSEITALISEVKSKGDVQYRKFNVRFNIIYTQKTSSPYCENRKLFHISVTINQLLMQNGVQMGYDHISPCIPFPNVLYSCSLKSPEK